MDNEYSSICKILEINELLDLEILFYLTYCMVQAIFPRIVDFT
jgi:hypothetical protein